MRWLWTRNGPSVVCGRTISAWLLVIDTGKQENRCKRFGCRRCDDVFFDQVRKRIYATGSEGAISVLSSRTPITTKRSGNSYSERARTGFFYDLERLYVAADGKAPRRR